MEQKFIPCFNKFGQWHYFPKPYTQDQCNFLLSEIKHDQTTILPYNCTSCPEFMVGLYAKLKLMSLFVPKSFK